MNQLQILLNYLTGPFSQLPPMIKCKIFKLNEKFSFQCVSEATARKAVKNLPSDKVTAGEISVNVLRNSEICFFDLTNCTNEAIRNRKFPDSLKLSHITPAYNNLILVMKLITYQSVFTIVLENIWKHFFSEWVIVWLIQKWQAELDQGGYVATILMDLSKAYGCLSHDLLIAKLEAYRFDIGNLNFLSYNLSLRKHITKVGSL